MQDSERLQQFVFGTLHNTQPSLALILERPETDRETDREKEE